MRIFEITGPRLFLCTTSERVIGSDVYADEPTGLLSEELEDILEAERPASSVPRRASFVLVPHPTGTQFAYYVTPLGRLERHHTGWLKLLAAADPLQEGVRRHYAQGYWRGGECPEERREPWEHRAEAVRIISRVGGSSRLM